MRQRGMGPLAAHPRTPRQLGAHRGGREQKSIRLLQGRWLQTRYVRERRAVQVARPRAPGQTPIPRSYK